MAPWTRDLTDLQICQVENRVEYKGLGGRWLGLHYLLSQIDLWGSVAIKTGTDRPPESYAESLARGLQGGTEGLGWGAIRERNRRLGQDTTRGGMPWEAPEGKPSALGRPRSSQSAARREWEGTLVPGKEIARLKGQLARAESNSMAAKHYPARIKNLEEGSAEPGAIEARKRFTRRVRAHRKLVVA
jgi:hypothetical protein